jgi:hypothetical protein
MVESDLDRLIPMIKRNLLSDDAKFVEQMASNVLKKNDAVKMIHNVSSMLGIKKPVVVTNSPVNTTTYVNNTPVIALSHPIYHENVVSQLKKVVMNEKPTPKNLFNLGVLSSLPVGIIAGATPSKTGILPAITTLAESALAIPKLYQDIKLHHVTNSPYSEQDIIQMGKYLSPILLTKLGLIIGRKLL